jgi:RNA recognition motif-containing protein
MSTKLYVGNLSWQATADDLRQAFSAYGEVEDAFIPSDRETGR